MTFEVDGGEIADGRVSPERIVESFDEVEDGVGGRRDATLQCDGLGLGRVALKPAKAAKRCLQRCAKRRNHRTIGRKAS